MQTSWLKMDVFDNPTDLREHIRYFPLVRKYQQPVGTSYTENVETILPNNTSADLIFRPTSNIFETIPNIRWGRPLELFVAKSPSLPDSIHIFPMVSHMLQRLALSLSVRLLRCPAVAIATAPKPRPEPILAARSWSLAAARAAALPAALSAGVWGVSTGSGALLKVGKLSNLGDRRFEDSELRLLWDSPPPTPAAAIARAIAAGGEANAAAHAGEIMAKAA
jgi:hypothetical protein